jgi:putative ABC transport system permease protein
MRLFNLISIAYRSLNKNKVRSFLTMLGIIIGVFSVIVMLSIGYGSREDIQDSIASMGTNVLMIFPGSSFRGGVAGGSGTGESLEMEDVTELAMISNSIRYISPVAQSSGQVIFGNANWNTSVIGVYDEYFEIRDLELSGGFRFSESEVRSAAKVCIVGQTVVDNLFGTDVDPIGQRIRIKKIPFTVIGVLESKGQSGMGQDQDDVIYAPYNTIKKRMKGTDNKVDQIYISAVSEEKITQATDDIDNYFRDKFHTPLSEDLPVSVRSQQEIADTFNSVSQSMIILLASIAAISLLVGGIGIMNIMLVSVTERTREIGLRMSVGARGRDIMRQFLLEAVLLSLLGGTLGVLGGIGISNILENSFGMSILIMSSSVLLSFMVAFGIGVFFGWYPARKASRLIPIDALRYE